MLFRGAAFDLDEIQMRFMTWPLFSCRLAALQKAPRATSNAYFTTSCPLRPVAPIVVDDKEGLPGTIGDFARGANGRYAKTDAAKLGRGFVEDGLEAVADRFGMPADDGGSQAGCCACDPQHLVNELDAVDRGRRFGGGVLDRLQRALQVVERQGNRRCGEVR